MMAKVCRLGVHMAGFPLDSESKNHIWIFEGLRITKTTKKEELC